MVETAVEVLRVPVAVLGVGGVLLSVGIILSERRRYSGGAPRSDQRRYEESGTEDER